MDDATAGWERCFALPAAASGALAVRALDGLDETDAESLLVVAAQERAGGVGHPYRALAYVDAADAALAGSSAAPAWCRPVAALLRARQQRALGRISAARATLAAARETIDASQLPFAERLRLTGVARVDEGLCEALAGEVPAALDALAHGVALLGGTLPEVRGEAHGMAAVLGVLTGRLAFADESLAEVAGCHPASVAGLPAELARVLLATERTTDPQLERVRRAVELARGTEYGGLALVALAYVLEAAGEHEQVMHVLWQADEAKDDYPECALVKFSALGVWLPTLVARHDLATALGALREVQPDPTHAVCPGSWEARVLLDTGDFARAIELTRPCLQLGLDHAARSYGHALAVHAAALAALRDTESADAVFARALSLAAVTGLRRIFTTLPPERMAELLQRAASAPLPDASRRVVAEVEAMLKPAPLPPVTLLSTRERIVLEQLVSGRSVHQIAWELSVSPNTVKTQTRSVYRKLGVASRESAVERARILGLVEP